MKIKMNSLFNVVFALFLLIVGVRKSLGQLKHKHSRIVGLLELTSSLFIFSFLFHNSLGLTTSSSQMKNILLLTAAIFTAQAIGLVTSDTKKRFSPVCYCVLLCVFLLVYLEEIKIPAFHPHLETLTTIPSLDVYILLTSFFGQGHIVGRYFEKTSKMHST